MKVGNVSSKYLRLWYFRVPKIHFSEELEAVARFSFVVVMTKCCPGED